MQIEKNAIRLTRTEALDLATRLMQMIASDMKLNDNDLSGVYIAPQPAMVYDKEMFSFWMVKG